jgi:hypothetical protein
MAVDEELKEMNACQKTLASGVIGRPIVSKCQQNLNQGIAPMV